MKVAHFFLCHYNKKGHPSEAFPYKKVKDLIYGASIDKMSIGPIWIVNWNFTM